MTQPEAMIYLADLRGCSKLASAWSFHVFNFGNYFDINRKPFGTLQVLNEDVLKGGAFLNMNVAENAEIILLPIVGGIEYQSNTGAEGFLEAGEVQIFSAQAGMNYQVTNPYESEVLVDFLQIWFSNSHSSKFSPKLRHYNFDLDTHKNQLLPIFECESIGFAYIGMYDGRAEDIYELKHAANNGIFVFIIEGAFEVQNRLLQPKDSLSLRGTPSIEFEALSNGAIILVMEIFNV